MDPTRRAFLVSSASLVAVACAKPRDPSDANKDHDDEDISAVEDLMREHGILRRALVVFRESARRLRTEGDVPPAALARAAKLFRDFGQDYHEKKLEEAILFPALRPTSVAPLVETLVAQHQRGRELVDYILARTHASKIDGAGAESLAVVLDGFARMYEAHTAREDTVVFPAWRKTMPPKDFEALGEKFDAIEKATFGHDGFDDGVTQMSEVEGAFAIDDLAALTAPPPPKLN